MIGDSSRRKIAVASVLIPFAAAVAQTVLAQEVRTTPVVEGIYLVSGAGGNVTVSVGGNGILIVDSGSAGMSQELLDAIREISDGTIRYIVNTSVLPDHRGGNAAIRVAGDTFTGGNATVVGGIDVGAAVIAHENTLHRMVADSDLEPIDWPTETFFVRKVDLYFNGEPVELMHQPSAVDNSNLIVHFRRSDVISTGDVFRLDSYPVIDLDNGGSLAGILASLNALVDLAVSDTLAEGGTLIIPGHGRICDEGDLVRYRDMVTIIRDRVQALIDEGHSLDEILEARVTLAYDSRYGTRNPDWDTEMFIEAVYRSLTESS